MAARTGFHHVAIRTADFDRSLEFDTGVLGLEVKVAWGVAPERIAFFRGPGGEVIGLFQNNPL